MTSTPDEPVPRPEYRGLFLEPDLSPLPVDEEEDEGQ